VPDGFDVIFLVSFCFALLGLAVLLLFVEPSQSQEREALHQQRSAGRALELFRIADFRAVIIVGSLLSAMTISDAFIYLTFHQRSGLATAVFPLLYVGTALVYLVLAVPIGRLADSVGRRRIFVAGHALLLALYGLLLLPHLGIVELVGCLVLLGAYYAMTDGVLMAVTSSVVPPALIATGLALVTTGTAAARFAGSVLYGAMWNWQGAPHALFLFLTGLSVTVCVGAILFGAPKGKDR
jgi:MFS family permease